MRKIILFLCVGFLWMPSNAFSQGMDWTFGNVNMNLRGDLAYTAQWRIEDQDERLVDDSQGNSNFEKGDMTNNKVSMRLEFETIYSHFTLFASAQALYDHVYTDDDLFSDETQEYAATYAEILDLYIEGAFNKLTFRLGNQVVQWGDAFAPVNAIAINTVNPIDLIKATTPGYDLKDYNRQALIAWVSYEPTTNWAIEGVYNPVFDPRYSLPVVGTFGSFTDIGFGGDGTIMGIPLVDGRPTEFGDMNSYGFKVRTMIPALNNFEIGLYYYHHFTYVPPIMTMYGFEDVLTDPDSFYVELSYPDMDMIGVSYATSIPLLDLSLAGEFAVRPNDPMQLEYIMNATEAALASLILGQPVSAGDPFPAPVGGYEETPVLYWNFNLGYILDFQVPFFGWQTSGLAALEPSGSIFLDYEDGKYADPKNRSWLMAVFDVSTFDILDSWETGIGFTYRDTLYKEQDSQWTLTTELSLRYSNRLELLFAHQLEKGDPAQYTTGNTSDRDRFTAQATVFF